MRTFRFLTVLGALALSCGDARRNPTPAAVTDAGATARFSVPIDGLPSFGADAALVTLVEFTDYDCAYCGKAQHTIEALRRKYGAELRVVVAERPLPIHPHARAAALAALAASGSPGFERFHASLFESPDSRADEALAELAIGAGVDRAAYARALASPEPAAALARSEKLADALHVRGTPAFFVNGRRIDGAQPLETFDSVVSTELAHALALVASGVRADRVYDAILDEARTNPAPFVDPPDESVLVPAARDVSGAPLYGRDDAKATLVLFTDFECPYCKRLDAMLRELVERHGDVRVVLRNRPLPMHPHARLAALAALAATAQGKLAAFAPLLFAHQDALERASLVSYASAAGLDVARFERDLDAPAAAAALAADEALAAKLDVRGTPTSFVDGRRIVGAQPLATFEAALPR